ncbi:MAG: glutamate--cysteine ligase [Verrucomicrobia bacterium]|nr:glutamate--cysteine ligase [Verrucomicrobiota bacterium]
MKRHYSLFEVVGVEIEYMIVDAESLDVVSSADRLISSLAGGPADEADFGPLTVSNELVSHVVELKVAKPVVSLLDVEKWFREGVGRLNGALEAERQMLMPGGAHPWMDPEKDARIWQHDPDEIYSSFDRIFGCRTHGWTNLQSMHINLPFDGDEQFGRLHAAIRLLLPILPALCASSPFLGGAATGLADSRMEAYRVNARKIPSISGMVIPEPIFTSTEYEREILQRLYHDIAPHDAKGILQYEWLNARGAIPRFERDTIEIRVMDTQECPSADIALARTVVELLRRMTQEKWCSFEDQCAWPVEPLRQIMLKCIQEGESTVIDSVDYLRMWGFERNSAVGANELWRHLVDGLDSPSAQDADILRTILDEGTLSSRLLRAAGTSPSRDALVDAYRDLCTCLSEDRQFRV